MTHESHLYGVPSISSSYQYLLGTHSGVASSPWSSLMSSIRILFGSSFTSTEQLDPSSSYQASSFGYHPMYLLYTRLPPYREQYAHSPYPPFSGGQPYVDMPSSLGKPRMTVCQWQPTMPVKPRLVYPSQPRNMSHPYQQHLLLQLYCNHKLKLLYLNLRKLALQPQTPKFQAYSSSLLRQFYNNHLCLNSNNFRLVYL